MKKKLFKTITTLCYEALAVLAMYFTIYFIGLIAEGDIFSVLDHADIEDFIIILLMLASVRVTIYDVIIKIKMMRNWFKEIKG